MIWQNGGNDGFAGRNCARPSRNDLPAAPADLSGRLETGEPGRGLGVPVRAVGVSAAAQVPELGAIPVERQAQPHRTSALYGQHRLVDLLRRGRRRSRSTPKPTARRHQTRPTSPRRPPGRRGGLYVGAMMVYPDPAPVARAPVDDASALHLARTVARRERQPCDVAPTSEIQGLKLRPLGGIEARETRRGRRSPPKPELRSGSL